MEIPSKSSLREVNGVEYIAHLPGVVTGFALSESAIDCICGKEIIKVDKRSGDIVCKKEIFEKEGLSRNLLADEEQIFIYDFCTLYILRRRDFELLGKWQLGDDLSSDICGMAVDQHTIYCSIRNGRIITLDRPSYAQKECRVSDSSMWSLKLYNQHLVCGTVDGKLLLLDKATCSIEKTLVLSKKNIGSLYLQGDTLYAASHDGKLFKVDMKRFEITAIAKDAHKKMFHCAGILHDQLITVSYPCSEIAFWNQDTLEEVKVMEVPLRLSGRAAIEHDVLYLSSRIFSGIGIIR